MKKLEYIKPQIKSIIPVHYLMDSLSVIDDDDPIDNEDEILDHPSNPGWGWSNE